MRTARRAYGRKDVQLRNLIKEETRINVDAVRQDEDARANNQAVTKQKLSHQEALVTAATRQVCGS